MARDRISDAETPADPPVQNEPSAELQPEPAAVLTSEGSKTQTPKPLPSKPSAPKHSATNPPTQKLSAPNPPAAKKPVPKKPVAKTPASKAPNPETHALKAKTSQPSAPSSSKTPNLVPLESYGTSEPDSQSSSRQSNSKQAATINSDVSTEQSPLLCRKPANAPGKKSILQHLKWPSKASRAATDAKQMLLWTAQPIIKHPIISFLLLCAVIFLIVGLRILFPPDPDISAPWMPEYTGRRNFTIPPYRPEMLATNYSLPLRAEGRNIVDQTGRRFKLAAINWYGASDELFVAGGLDIRHRSEISTLIRNMGFNTVRLPYSDEMVALNPVVPARHIAANPDLVGKRALDIFHAVVHALTHAGIAVIINDHITKARWCCDGDPCDAAWSNSYLGPMCPVRQTSDEWIQRWTHVMQPLANNSLVIGADLRNEVRGLWGTMPWASWAAAAEDAAETLLRINPDWLMIVEGTSSANDLTGASERPVKLSRPGRLVYSAHVYSWSGWGSLPGRYSLREYASFAKDMQRNWAYLLEQNVAPVWIGEVGAPVAPGKGDANYWRNLVKFLHHVDADFGYWAINPRKPYRHTYESYGLVEDDWKTVVKDYRLRDMLRLMNVTVDGWRH
ncbi:hypothetical protein TD95_003706 [Thielaviopsis punctulata]|uniref:Glycoside hydrolase family 5 domain-containing protein n=1 Tax=Thielaviopsis punctulata TaxID=72032 RepID=A0A0F4ZF90_9PEZI|nr:hypothetical protein TD95_003706 [Thielaviopsis punctulata]